MVFSPRIKQDLTIEGMVPLTRFDLVLSGGRVVDPQNGVDAVLDVGIIGGQIAAVESSISGARARRIIDVSGDVVFPGVVDSHVHVGRGRGVGYRMTAAVGVTTLVDFGCAMADLLPGFREGSVGQTVGALYPINRYLSSQDAQRCEIETLVDGALAEGSLGIKIVGGHYPLTPETTAVIIDVANDRRCYVAFHLGTTDTGSHLEGVREVPRLIGDNRLHVAHLNSYCRGMVKDPAEEALEAVSIMDALDDQVVTESYLGTINGTSGKCADGVPESHVTRNCLLMKGYEPSVNGLRQAIADGFGYVRVERGGHMVLVGGEEGVELWEAVDTDLPMSFPVNSPQATFITATAKNDRDEFIVDAISTDGGGNPRNVAVERGMALVRYGALTLQELAEKVSAAPAEMLGLTSKGHLGEGADADITVIDPVEGVARMAVAGGQLIMLGGVVIGDGGSILTTSNGVSTLTEAACPASAVDLEQSRLYR